MQGYPISLNSPNKYQPLRENTQKREKQVQDPALQFWKAPHKHQNDSFDILESAEGQRFLKNLYFSLGF